MVRSRIIALIGLVLLLLASVAFGASGPGIWIAFPTGTTCTGYVSSPINDQTLCYDSITGWQAYHSGAFTSPILGGVPCSQMPALTGDTTSSAGTCATITLKTNGVAFAASATTDTTNAANISSGILAAARGGAGTVNGALKANGAGLVTQAACADLSNGAASCSTDTTNATNISSGTLNNSRLPAAVSVTSVTTTGDVTDNQLANGNCVQAGASGKLTTVVGACGVAAGNFPGGNAPQIAGYSALNVPESETLGGDCTLSRTGANAYSANCTKLNGVSPGNANGSSIGVNLNTSVGNPAVDANTCTNACTPLYSFSVPAMTATNTLRFTAIILGVNTAGATSMEFTATFGGTTLCDTGGNLGNIANNATPTPFKVVIEIANLNSTNAQMTHCWLMNHNQVTATQWNNMVPGTSGALSDSWQTTAIDTTSARILALNIIFGASSGSTHMKLYMGRLEEW